MQLLKEIVDKIPSMKKIRASDWHYITLENGDSIHFCLKAWGNAVLIWRQETRMYLSEILPASQVKLIRRLVRLEYDKRVQQSVLVKIEEEIELLKYSV